MLNVASKSADPQVEEHLPKELSSSTTLPWEGFRVCRQILVPQTFGGYSVDPEHRHLMTLLLSPTSKCERLGPTGKYVLYRRSSGEIANHPQRRPVKQPPSR